MTAPNIFQPTRRDLLKWSATLPAIAAFAPVLAHAQGTPAPAPALVTGNTAFALDLYARLRESAGDNLLVSPYSISLALAMTGLGARDETATQMSATLGFDVGDPHLHDAFGALTADLVARGADGDTEAGLRIANALWGEASWPFREAYSEAIAQDYGAELQRTDFINAPEEARVEINDWVADQTEDRIEDIVPPGAISAATRLVLANAIWFYGPWRDTFEAADTSDDVFHLLDGGEATASFMRQQETFAYAAGDGYQAIELPYAQDGFAMTFLLPDDGGFEAFEAGLDAAALDAAVAALERTPVRLVLPKFEFSFGASLAKTLVAMGMTDAFDPARADFSGMIEGEPLAIGDVLHKAFISIDEDGTEAAAATVVIAPTSAPAPTEEPVEVRLDRPFLFAIRDTTTGTVLFLGRVLDPSGGDAG